MPYIIVCCADPQAVGRATDLDRVRHTGRQRLIQIHVEAVVAVTHAGASSFGTILETVGA